MINVVKTDLNHHNCFLSFSFPCFILSFLSSPFPFHASSLHSFPHLFLSMLHPLIPFPTFSFPCFIPSFLSPPFPFYGSSLHSFPHLFLSMLHPIIPFLPFLSLMKHHPQISLLLYALVRFPTSPTSEQRPSWSPQPLAD